MKNPNQGRGSDLDRIEGEGAPVRDADAGVVAHARSSDGRVGHDHADAPSEPKPATEGDRASDPPGAARSWDIDDALERGLSPTDYLIGHMLGRWVGDEESVYKASAALLAASFSQAGMSDDRSVDLAMELMDRGATLRWDGRTLGFDFDPAEDGAE